MLGETITKRTKQKLTCNSTVLAPGLRLTSGLVCQVARQDIGSMFSASDRQRNRMIPVFK